MADDTSTGHHAPDPEPPAAHHDHHHAAPEPAPDPLPPSQSDPHHKHHPQNGALDDTEGLSGDIGQQQYTYGSFDDAERQGQRLPAPQPQELWPLFFALVVLACFLIFLIVPLVSPS